MACTFGAGKKLDDDLFRRPNRNNTPGVVVAFIAFFLVHISPGALADEKDSITWLVRDFPPIFILQGEYKGRGMGDLMIDSLIKGMPEYAHSKSNANMKDVEMLMSNGRKVCRLVVIKKPEREKYMHFSIPHIVTPSLKLFVRKEKAPMIRELISNRNTVSLEKIMLRTELTIGVEVKRSYGASLDSILESFEGTLRLFPREGKDNPGLVKMFCRGRFDCIIEFPWVFVHAVQKDETILQEMESLEIEEAPPYMVGSAATPKNAWGRAVITRVNVIFEKELREGRYRWCVEQWLDKGSIESFRQEYKRLFQHP